MIPKLRFPEFIGDWNQHKLEEISTFYNGKAYKRSELKATGRYPILRVGNLFTNPEWYYSSDELPEHKMIENDDLIYAWSASFGPRIWKGDKVIYHYHIWKVVNDNDLVDKYFLYHLLDIETAKMKSSNSNGFALLHITKGTIESWPVNIPNKREQIKIRQLLDVLDHKISLLTKKKEALESYKKGLMQKIFSQELRFKREDGTDYPDWEENEIGQIFKEIRDKVGDSVVETFSITAGKGFVSQAEKFGRDISGSQNPNYIRLKPNQYSYNKGNSKTFKYGCVYRNLIGKDIAVPNVFISLDLLNGDYRYFDALFESHLLDRHLRRIISSSARMDGLLNIPKRDFFLISLPVPCLEEQAKIGQSMHQLNKSIGVIERQIQNVISLKKGLLQQMFV